MVAVVNGADLRLLRQIAGLALLLVEERATARPAPCYSIVTGTRESVIEPSARSPLLLAWGKMRSTEN